MKFVIKGKEYDPKLGLQKVSLNTLFELKVKHNVGVRDLQAAALRLEKIKDPLDLLEDVEAFQTFLIVIWLARRFAGDVGVNGKPITLTEANDDFAITDLLLLTEDGDEEPAPDPKAQTPKDSVRGGKRKRTT